MRALALFALLWATPTLAQMVFVMSRSGYVRDARNSSSEDCHHAQAGEALVIQDEDQTNGYYHVLAQNGCDGYVYKGLGRRRPDAEMPAWASGGGGAPGVVASTGDGRLTICSFNIKWLGHYTRKKHQALANMMADYDMVIVQELMDPPVALQLPGRSIEADEHSAQFFQFMEGHGFRWALSESGTGKPEPPGGGNAQEWPAVFYRDDEVRFVDEQSSFLSSQTIENTVFDRVPYAFHFAAHDGSMDFTVINSHLTQGRSSVNATERQAELNAIARWCAQTTAATNERDFLIVGDLNLKDQVETMALLPAGFAALNSNGTSTTMSNTNGGSPYDNVLYQTSATANDLVLGNSQFTVLDLRVLANTHWDVPGSPPTGDDFSILFSDHKPVVFEMRYGAQDDD